MSKKEEVIMLNDVKNVGKRGDIKLVNSSFASNFLFPNKNAIPCNKENSIKLKLKKSKELEKDKIRLTEEEELFKKLNNLELFFQLKKEKDKIFGSIGLGEITKKLKENNFQIQDKKKFINFYPIISEGIHIVNLKINKYLTASLKIIVSTQTS
jgi:large subunit ribosomal protein L9